MLQEERRLGAPDQASALDAFLASLHACIAIERDFAQCQSWLLVLGNMS